MKYLFRKEEKCLFLNSSETLNKSSNVASIQKTLIVPEMLRDLYQFKKKISNLVLIVGLYKDVAHRLLGNRWVMLLTTTLSTCGEAGILHKVMYES